MIPKKIMNDENIEYWKRIRENIITEPLKSRI